MENCLIFADGLGPTKIVHVYEPSIQLRAVLVGVADSQGATYNRAGLDVLALNRLKEEGASVGDYSRGARLDGMRW